MKDSDRFEQYRTGMNVLFKYVPDFSSPLMIEGVMMKFIPLLSMVVNID